MRNELHTADNGASGHTCSGFRATSFARSSRSRFRQVAQTHGALTVYLQVPGTYADRFRELLVAIGYWGQTDSLAMCLAVEEAVPDQRECAVPLRLLHGGVPLSTYFTCVLADFRDQTRSWEEVVEGMHANEEDPLLREVYLWPMSLVERRAENTVYALHPFSDAPFWEESKQSGSC